MSWRIGTKLGRTLYRDEVLVGMVDTPDIAAEIVGAGESQDRAYSERNRLVAFLARCYPSGLRKTDIPGWDPCWHNCVFIDTPAGQMSWHFHDNDASLFEALPPYDKPWDGHTTDEKYDRLRLLTSSKKAKK